MPGTDREALLVAAGDQVLTGIPTTGPDSESAAATETACADGVLRFQQCEVCGYLRYPAGTRCPQCLNTGGVWVADDGAGRVWSACTYHRSFNPAFAGVVPYAVALVELESGPRLVTAVLDLEAEPPIGTPVTVAPVSTASGRIVLFARVRTEQ